MTTWTKVLAMPPSEDMIDNSDRSAVLLAVGVLVLALLEIVAG